MNTSTTVVEARAYSFAKGLTADEIEHATSPSSSADEFAQPQLMRRVQIRIQHADRHSVDVATLQARELKARLILVELNQDLPGCRDPLADPSAEVSWNSGAVESPNERRHPASESASSGLQQRATSSMSR